MVARDSCGDTTGLLRGVLMQQVVVAVSFRVEDAIAFIAMARDRQSTHRAAGGRKVESCWAEHHPSGSSVSTVGNPTGGILRSGQGR